MELHLSERDPGWCLTYKIPLRDAAGKVIGLAGISRDLQAQEEKSPAYQKICNVMQHIRENFSEDIKLPLLAELAGMSVSQIERYFDVASRTLQGSQSSTDLAMSCDYRDHSAFARQFKATVGMTPTQYRQLQGQAVEQRTRG